MELFFDLYGNSLITEKHGQILDALLPQLKKYFELIKKFKQNDIAIFTHFLCIYIYTFFIYSLINDDEKHKTPLKELIVLKELKYKEHDDLVDIFSSWNSKVAFTMEKFR